MNESVVAPPGALPWSLLRTLLLESPWRWTLPAGLVAWSAVLALLLYSVFLGREAGRRWWLAAAATLLTIVACASPLASLADGQLFVAHMLQHLTLLLLVPLLLVASLPRAAMGRLFERPGFARLGRLLAVAPLGWLAGVGAMWLWHEPAACSAGIRSAPIGVLRDVSFVLAGVAFWWPIASPLPGHRIEPPTGLAYLISACIACTVLGIGVTFTSTLVCPLFATPSVAFDGPLPGLARLRELGLTPQVDQQLGGLLMWVAPCLLYMLASMAMLRRWHRPSPAAAGVVDAGLATAGRAAGAVARSAMTRAEGSR